MRDHELSPAISAAKPLLPRERWRQTLERWATLRREHEDRLNQLRASVPASQALRRSMRERAEAARRPITPLAISVPRPGAGEPIQGGALRDRYGMTVREAQTAMLLAAGHSNAAIAAALAVSPHTARHHTESVLVKLGVHSRSQAATVLLRGAPVGPKRPTPPALP